MKAKVIDCDSIGPLNHGPPTARFGVQLGEGIESSVGRGAKFPGTAFLSLIDTPHIFVSGGSQKKK
jgi:hypothetical protein